VKLLQYGVVVLFYIKQVLFKYMTIRKITLELSITKIKTNVSIQTFL
ncbi:hypothetical protein V543_02569, partial [Staphylococcus aureus T16619]